MKEAAAHVTLSCVVITVNSKLGKAWFKHRIFAVSNLIDAAKNFKVQFKF